MASIAVGDRRLRGHRRRLVGRDQAGGSGLGAMDARRYRDRRGHLPGHGRVDRACGHALEPAIRRSAGSGGLGRAVPDAHGGRVAAPVS